MTVVCVLMQLDGTVYFSGSQAFRADIGSSDRAIVINSYSLNIRVPFSSGMSVRMGNLIPGRLTLSANFTFPGHLPHLPSMIEAYDPASAFSHDSAQQINARFNSHE